MVENHFADRHLVDTLKRYNCYEEIARAVSAKYCVSRTDLSTK